MKVLVLLSACRLEIGSYPSGWNVFIHEWNCWSASARSKPQNGLKWESVWSKKEREMRCLHGHCEAILRPRFLAFPQLLSHTSSCKRCCSRLSDNLWIWVWVEILGFWLNLKPIRGFLLSLASINIGCSGYFSFTFKCLLEFNI